ncbi:hypothetical protein [Nitrincola sp. MINF-07-Sa-05]|uniref:hypothetical protein n=1 Tax=Nitrincola salilacus TaxID=3400273 RepID=UPI0039181758
MEQQTEEINASAVAMNEMTATLEEVAANTQQSADGSRLATEAVNGGTSKVEQS